MTTITLIKGWFHFSGYKVDVTSDQRLRWQIEKNDNCNNCGSKVTKNEMNFDLLSSHIIFYDAVSADTALFRDDK